MFTFAKKTKPIESYDTVIGGLKKLYKSKLFPLEEAYNFPDFHSPFLDDADFDAQPMLLLVGQYSTGKTTFIRYLLEHDYPGMRIGPEPTTDRFIAVMHGESESTIPGNALVSDPTKQFRPLQKFGSAFLNRLQASVVPNEVLKHLTFIDTPGILSGEKQRVDRGYDFATVLEWFAERVDRIILLFDAHKLDISDEFRTVIERMRAYDDKIRIVLNKADRIDAQQLMRVYGALMWSLGKVFATPEVTRVYLGSFWDEPRLYDENRKLFELEESDLFHDLQSLPRSAALRKLNDLIRRARMAKVHAYIISELKEQMPSVFGKDKAKKDLIAKLDTIYTKVSRDHAVPIGDMPDITRMREALGNQDFTKFNSLKPKLIAVVDDMLARDIAQLMTQIPKEEEQYRHQETAINLKFANFLEDTKWGVPRTESDSKLASFFEAVTSSEPTSGAFVAIRNDVFGVGALEGVDAGRGEAGWIVDREREEYDESFNQLNPIDGKISGAAAKQSMIRSRLPNAVLGKIWKLSDIDRDGMLDADEWALANHLIKIKLGGHELPTELPSHLIPPSKRGIVGTLNGV